MIRISDTPVEFKNLKLMKQLREYADGLASWRSQDAGISDSDRNACDRLYSNLVTLEEMVRPILNRTTNYPLDHFTMHDAQHSWKVIHLMGCIISPERQERALCPPEIGLLISVALLHDIGMALSAEERHNRLKSAQMRESPAYIEVEAAYRHLISESEGEDLESGIKVQLRERVLQAEEVLLMLDTRERHATKERYLEVIDQLKTGEVTAKSLMQYAGVSFLNEVIDICVSHNEDADVLLKRNPTNPSWPRFLINKPFHGGCSVNIHMIAAALRLADILDFDRERTPPSLFHYLLPGALSNLRSQSALEWSKHMAITNWYIDDQEIVYDGVCENHIVHHAIVQFCALISDELRNTKNTFKDAGNPWPFNLPIYVRSNIQEIGYKYVPYTFVLDDQRIYEMLMGGAIYDNPLDAVRELVQNSVDACVLRDQLDILYSRGAIAPSKQNRIIMEYREYTGNTCNPQLIIQDTGTGMDNTIIKDYFLRVGQSFYRSKDFEATRRDLRESNLDFAPISEFGIGFLSSFMLADSIKVETALWRAIREDSYLRTLHIDGPTRLIQMQESENVGYIPFTGTKITLDLCRGGKKVRLAQNINTDENTSLVMPKSEYPPTYDEIVQYLKNVCLNLPYEIECSKYVDEKLDTGSSVRISAKGLKIDLPDKYKNYAWVVEINDNGIGLEGQILFWNNYALRSKGIKIPQNEMPLPEQVQKALDELVRLLSATSSNHVDLKVRRDRTELIRAGFMIGNVPNLPENTYKESDNSPEARLSLTWKNNESKRYDKPNLARDRPADSLKVRQSVTKAWLRDFLDHADMLPYGLIQECDLPDLNRPLDWTWLFEEYNLYDIYRLARNYWKVWLERMSFSSTVEQWETRECPRLPLPLNYLAFKPASWGWLTNLMSAFLTISTARVTKLSFYDRYLSKEYEGRRREIIRGYWVSSPNLAWIDSLKESIQFEELPHLENAFQESLVAVEYADELSGYFYHTSSMSLNSMFVHILTDFEREELRSIAGTIDKMISIVNRKQGSPKLDDKDRHIISKLASIKEELKVATKNTKRHTVSSIIASLPK